MNYAATMTCRPYTPAILLVLSMAGCSQSESVDLADEGPEPTPQTVSGSPTALGTCETPKVAKSQMGTVTVQGNTEGGPVNALLDLGYCGRGTGPTVNQPQDVIQYVVPGNRNTQTKVVFRLANPGTDPYFAAVIQLRTQCDEVPLSRHNGELPRPTCFDDAPPGFMRDDERDDEEGVLVDEHRPYGRISVPAQTTLFFVITGRSHVMPQHPDPPLASRGPYELSITATPAVLPELVSATASIRTMTTDWDARPRKGFTARVQGENKAEHAFWSEKDPFGLTARFLDADDRPVDFNGDSLVNDRDRIWLIFDNYEVNRMPRFTGVFGENPNLRSSNELSPFQVASGVTAHDAVKVELQLMNSQYTLSEPVTVDIDFQ